MSSHPDVFTVVMQLPADPEQRKAVTQALSIGGDFHGAKITAASMEDEISTLEFIETALEEEGLFHVLEQAREKAKALHLQKPTST